MPVKQLVPDVVVRSDGIGPEVDLGPVRGKLAVITLGIERVIEQGALEISVWGSRDGVDWGSHALVTFPSKSYCGTYSQLLKLAEHPDVRWLRVQWKVSRWAKDKPTAPLFGFNVSLEETGARARPNTAAVA